LCFQVAIVAQEEKKFSEIERRHFHQKTNLVGQAEVDPTFKFDEYSALGGQGNLALSSIFSVQDRFDDVIDVTSIRTEHGPLSKCGELPYLENHIYSNSHSHGSLHNISRHEFHVDNDSVDGQIKERVLTQLTLENKTLREDLTQAKGKVFQLESDLDYLRTTIEKNLPFFN